MYSSLDLDIRENSVVCLGSNPYRQIGANQFIGRESNIGRPILWANFKNNNSVSSRFTVAKFHISNWIQRGEPYARGTANNALKVQSEPFLRCSPLWEDTFPKHGCLGANDAKEFPLPANVRFVPFAGTRPNDARIFFRLVTCMNDKKQVLILCTGNSCRSQMAQVIWNQLGTGQWQAYSAGSKPAGYVHPLGLKALQELDLPTEGLTSKSVDEFKDHSFDLAISVCDNAKNDCPVLPGVAESLHWPFDDPADATGTDDEKILVFRRVRDEIQEKIKSYLQS